MRRIFTISIFLALSIALAAQQPGIHAAANPAAEAEIKALELKLADLMVRGDWDEYAKHLASDYLYTDNGHVESRDEALANLRDSKRKFIVMEIESEDLTIRIYGDMAVSGAKYTATVRESGQVKSHLARVTDVFIKRDGQWYVIAGQAATIAK